MNKERLIMAGGASLVLGAAVIGMVCRKRYEANDQINDHVPVYPSIEPAPLEITYYDEQTKLTTRESDQRFENLHEHLNYDYLMYNWALRNHTVEKDKEFLAEEATARQYMEDLGFSDLPNVYLVDEEPEDQDYFKFKKTPTMIAFHDGTFNLIVMRDKRIKELQEKGHTMQITVTLVHEFVHATRSKKRLSALLRKDHEYPWYAGREGFHMNVKNEFQGSFYEEGVAAFVESRFVRSLKGDTRAIGIDGVPTPELPWYLQPPDPSMTCGPDGYAMELIAYGLEKRGIMSAEGFADLLLAARRDDTELDALRAFAAAVEKLRPGLYVELRKLEYGKKTWKNACQMIYDIVVAE